MEFKHLSVLQEEVVAWISPHAGGLYLDGTVGGGGHSKAILEASEPDGRIICFDRDKAALTAAEARFAGFGGRTTLVHASFSEMAVELSSRGISGVDGIILDLGVSSYQLDTGSRGFSFQQDAPLDMRMDSSQPDTAADLVNDMSEEGLNRIIWEYGEERWAKRIASFIVRAREEQRVETTMQLVDIIKGAIPRAKWEDRLHPATRTFQALRIAVNNELEELEKGLSAGVTLLKQGGRIAVISFHSLEDRIVKEHFKSFSSGCVCPREMPVCSCGHRPKLRVLTRKPLVAGSEEIARNPRARSARLRVAEKLAEN